MVELRSRSINLVKKLLRIERSNPYLIAGTIEWRLNGPEGPLHRDFGPARESAGHKEWLQNGRLHRVNGPAIENGESSFWFFNGKPHRLDGPALILNSGSTEYWINGIMYSESDYWKEINKNHEYSLKK
jgi:hypothetical protein